jgi:siderophore synthetase component
VRPKAVSARPSSAADERKDEVYRQMLRVEAARPAAQLDLAVALLEAWVSLEGQQAGSEARRWLRRISPVCLRMIRPRSSAH